MRKRTLLIVLTALLTLGTAPMLGCSGGDDPSQNNGNNGNNGTEDTGTDDTGDEDTGDEDTGGEDAGDDTNTDDGGGDDGEGNDGGGECVPFTDFTGQAFTGGENPGPHNGGNPIEGGSVDYDAGLQALYEAVPTSADDENVADESTENTDIYTRTLDTAAEVDGALVISTGFDSNQTPDVDEANQKFWLIDTNSQMQFWFAFPDGEVPTDPIKVGDRVSFSATKVTYYGGTPEITEIDATTFSVDSSDNDVPFTDYTGMDIPVDDYLRPVRIAGTITSSGEACGTPTCFELSHGPEGSQKTVELRTNSQFIEQGDCVTYFGPLGAFPTPLSDPDAATPQLNELNFNWLFTSQ